MPASKKPYYEDAVHLNDEGVKIVNDRLASEIQRVRRPRWPFVLGLLIVLIILYASLTGCAGTRAFWNDSERMKTAFHVTNGLDAATTIARDRDCTIERSLILGDDPPPEKVAIFAIVQSLGVEWLWPHLSETERLWVARIGTILHLGAAANNATINARGCP